MGRDTLVVELPTKSKKLSLYLVFPTKEATPRHYIIGPTQPREYTTATGRIIKTPSAKELVKILLDKSL